MEKAYIANLRFKFNQWQLWFMAEDNEEMNNKWKEACSKLNEVGDKCTETDEFYAATIAHFESFGFAHIAK